MGLDKTFVLGHICIFNFGALHILLYCTCHTCISTTGTCQFGWANLAVANFGVRIWVCSFGCAHLGWPVPGQVFFKTVYRFYFELFFSNWVNLFNNFCTRWVAISVNKLCCVIFGLWDECFWTGIQYFAMCTFYVCTFDTLLIYH